MKVMRCTWTVPIVIRAAKETDSQQLGELAPDTEVRVLELARLENSSLRGRVAALSAQAPASQLVYEHWRRRWEGPSNPLRSMLRPAERRVERASRSARPASLPCVIHRDYIRRILQHRIQKRTN